MAETPKPRIVVSRCIEFDNCRWNGLRISSDAVKALMPFVEFIHVCPEVEIGLGVPRAPVRLVSQNKGVSLIQAETGRDITQEMKSFSLLFLDSLEDIDAFILKERSPSCGLRNAKVYPDALKTGPLHVKGSGIFAIEAEGRFPLLPMEDEGRLNNYEIREHFLTRVFTLARFRARRAAGTAGSLVEFHTEHKLLLMAYSQADLKKLGTIVSNPGKAEPDGLFGDYADVLCAALNKRPSPGQAANVLMHAFGHVSEKITAPEKQFFLDSLRRYREHRIPLSVPIAIMRSLIARFDDRYLSGQRFFEPFPEGLVQVTDSGKGREVRR